MHAHVCIVACSHVSVPICAPVPVTQWPETCERVVKTGCVQILVALLDFHLDTFADRAPNNSFVSSTAIASNSTSLAPTMAPLASMLGHNPNAQYGDYSADAGLWLHTNFESTEELSKLYVRQELYSFYAASQRGKATLSMPSFCTAVREAFPGIKEFVSPRIPGRAVLFRGMKRRSKPLTQKEAWWMLHTGSPHEPVHSAATQQGTVPVLCAHICPAVPFAQDFRLRAGAYVQCVNGPVDCRATAPDLPVQPTGNASGSPTDDGPGQHTYCMQCAPCSACTNYRAVLFYARTFSSREDRRFTLAGGESGGEKKREQQAGGHSCDARVTARVFRGVGRACKSVSVCSSGGRCAVLDLRDV